MLRREITAFQGDRDDDPRVRPPRATPGARTPKCPNAGIEVRLYRIAAAANARNHTVGTTTMGNATLEAVGFLTGDEE